MQIINVTLKQLQDKFSHSMVNVLRDIQIDGEVKTLNMVADDYIYHYRNLMGSRKDLMVKTIKDLISEELLTLPDDKQKLMDSFLDIKVDFLLTVTDHNGNLLCALVPAQIKGEQY